jgi:hypothetical protein
MGFLKNWRERRLKKKVAEHGLKKLAEEDLSLVVENRGVMPAPIETEEQGTVTGIYQAIGAMVQEVIEDKKKGKEAARRITETIGAPPVVSHKK